MTIQPFKLERYFARYEFSTRFLLSPSDCESLGMAELLAMANPESRQNWDALSLGYTESQGSYHLRQEIARGYRSISPEQVLVAAPEEAIYISMRTLLAPGDEVVAITPAYQSLYEVANAIGCKLIPWQVRLGPDGWELNLEELRQQISHQTRLLVINFPHNPTGCLATHAEYETILQIARENDLVLFSDEMYRLLEYDPSERLIPACDRYHKALSLGGLSKSLALPGLRIGWLATQDTTLLERIQAYKDYTTICSSAPSEVLGLIALQNQAAIVARNLAIIQENLAAAQAFCARQAEQLRWLEPRAGSVAFPQWLGETPVEALCQRALDEQGVMVVPGSMFDYPGGHFRVGLGRRNFPQALARFEKVLGSTKRETF